MESTTIPLARQVKWVIWLYLPMMIANAIAVEQWSITRPISVNATVFMIAGRSILGDSSGHATAATFAVYALLNLAVVWCSVLLILRGPRVLGWTILLLLVASVLPFYLAERPAPFW